MNSHMKPKDAQVEFDGSFYKIGLHGYPYRYTGEQWVRSNKTKEEVVGEIDKQERKSKSLL